MMNVINIELPDRIPHPFEDERATIPVAIPDWNAAIQFGKAKHALRQPWRGTAFGWPAEYRLVGNLPAGFFIGVNGIYFVSLDWELGIEEEPFVYIEDDYGYEFDEASQIERIKQQVPVSAAA